MLYLTREQINGLVDRLGQPQASLLLNEFFNSYKHRLTSSDVAALYDEAYFDRIASHPTHELVDGEHSINIYTSHAFEYLRARACPDSRILDFGCGDGGFAAAVWHSCRCEVVGYDSQREAIDRARRLECDHEGLRFATGDLTTRSEGEFDYVVLNDVTEHLSDSELRQILRSLHGLLRPEGEILIHTPNGLALCNKTDRTVLTVLYERYLRMSAGWRGLERTPDQIYYDQVHINIKSFRQLRDTLAAEGFSARVLYDEPHRVPALSVLSSNMFVVGRKV